MYARPTHLLGSAQSLLGDRLTMRRPRRVDAKNVHKTDAHDLSAERSRESCQIVCAVSQRDKRRSVGRSEATVRAKHLARTECGSHFAPQKSPVRIGTCVLQCIIVPPAHVWHSLEISVNTRVVGRKIICAFRTRNCVGPADASTHVAHTCWGPHSRCLATA